MTPALDETAPTYRQDLLAHAQEAMWFIACVAAIGEREAGIGDTDGVHRAAVRIRTYLKILGPTVTALVAMKGEQIAAADEAAHG